MFTMSDGMLDNIITPEDMVNIFWTITTSEAPRFLLISRHLNDLKLQNILTILNYNMSWLL